VTRKRRDGGDLFAVDNHGETKPRIAGGVMFDATGDVPPLARVGGRGRAVAASRSPTAKAMPRGSAKGKRKTLSRQMLDHLTPSGRPTRG
jgi:hypothetical protein